MAEIYSILEDQSFPQIGVDEAGRGPLVGPVYAGAVWIDRPINIPGLTDSKKLSESRRIEICKKIKDELIWSVGFATAKEIDEINILEASFLAMKRAILGLKKKTPVIYVDGKFAIKNLDGVTQIPVIKGDQRVQSISAASILAKVFRDEHMVSLAGSYPQYGFEKHKGYPTIHHREAIKEYGPCKEHRKSFKGVKEFLQEI